MDADTQQKLAALEKKIDEIYVSVEKTRKYFLFVLIVTVIAFVLPLIGLVFAIPQFISMVSSVGGL